MIKMRPSILAAVLFGVSYYTQPSWAQHAHPTSLYVADVNPDGSQVPGVSIVVHDGVAILSGAADSEAMRQSYEQVAKNMRGVQRVEDRLTIQPMPAIPAPPAPSHPNDLRTSFDREKDRWTEEAITWKLFQHFSVPGEHVMVEVQNGTATLRGLVGRQKQSDWAEKIALAAGARRVVNQIEIR